MSQRIRIVGFGASLRKNSYNMLLLKECKRLFPEDVDYKILTLEGIPIYNQDQETERPESVKIFKDEIRASDGFVISTPEYNFSIPGFLKNALDHAGRPPAENPFRGKQGVIMSASLSMLGGARAQYHLRQVMGYLDTRIINRPEVFISFADKKFDQDGHINDEFSLNLMKQLLGNLVEGIRKEKNIVL